MIHEHKKENVCMKSLVSPLEMVKHKAVIQCSKIKIFSPPHLSILLLISNNKSNTVCV